MSRLPRSVLGIAVTLSVWVSCQPQPAPTLVKAPVQTAALPALPKTRVTVTPSTVAPVNCDALDGENRAAFNDVLPKWEDASFVDGGTAHYDDVLPNPCISAGTDAWGVALQSFNPYRYPMFDATWSLVHVDQNGKLLRYREDSSIFTVGIGGGAYGPTKFWAFDFDDDGEAELVFTYRLEPVETSEVFTMLAFQFKDGAVKPYVPVVGWTKLIDVDKDGRPDAIVEHNSEDYGGCGPYESETLLAPSLVAHSIPGGFSTTDSVAKRSATQGCPARPARVIAMDGKLVDEAATAKNVICARVWGASEASVVHEIDMACHPMICAGIGSRPLLPGECMHLQTLIKWAKEPPIVTLP